jgi:hypothetical protein
VAISLRETLTELSTFHPGTYSPGARYLQPAGVIVLPGGQAGFAAAGGLTAAGVGGRGGGGAGFTAACDGAACGEGGCGDGFTDAVVGGDAGFEVFDDGVATSGLVSVFDLASRPALVGLVPDVPTPVELRGSV